MQTDTNHSPSIKNIVLTVLGAAILFTLLSFLLFVIQVKRDHDKISGQVVEVEPGEIVIVDARGQKTTLQINESTSLNEGSGDVSEAIEIGMFIRSGGKRISDETFVPEGIRIIKRP